MVRDEFIDDIIKKEGGYVDNKNDAGGATKYGITQAVAHKYGYTGDMKSLPLSFAKQVYQEMYWDALNLNAIADLSPAVALVIGDIAVNMGVSRAGEFFQRVLNVMNKRGTLYPDLQVDGSIGARSLAAFKTFYQVRGRDGETVMIRALNCLKGEFYVSLAERRQTDEEFVFGWLLNRVA